jgi:ferrous iron transport protein A
MATIAPADLAELSKAIIIFLAPEYRALTMSPPRVRMLSDLAVGERAVVQRIRGERRTTVRLLEMGLVPGTTVELRRRAPLGDPLELRLRGYALSIRKSEAAGIEIDDEARA